MGPPPRTGWWSFVSLEGGPGSGDGVPSRGLGTASPERREQQRPEAVRDGLALTPGTARTVVGLDGLGLTRTREVYPATRKHLVAHGLRLWAGVWPVPRPAGGRPAPPRA